MSSQPDWHRVEDVLLAALDLDGPARCAYLEAECGTNEPLRREVESLLRSQERVGRFLDLPDDHGPRDEAVAPAAPSRVGPFKLVRRIGRGGMGEVFLAERDEDAGFTQRVAVKFVHVPKHDPSALRRFRAERQILASLQHPNIVSLIDGGLTAEGQAFLVMEYVDGVPITTYCRDRALPLEARLALFRQVAGAVHFAHRHLVVHRDLKPANILVTQEGSVKVLDFGVAKLLATAQDGPGATMTQAGWPGALTPDYASPEQLRGLPVTTASDIYSLGVLLYELVTGTRPYRAEGQALDALVRAMTTTRLRPSLAPVGPDRPPYDLKRLRGDLDAVAMKAMSSEADERYASADEFSDDLGRWLAGQPVVAREPSIWYLTTTLARRHRVPVAIGVVAVLAVVAALGVAMWQRQVAVRARATAERRLADVRELANALVFQVHDAVAPLPGSTPVRKLIVSQGLKYLDVLSREDVADVRLLREIAGGYRRIGSVQGGAGAANLGDREGAIASFRTAIAMLDRVRALEGDGTSVLTEQADAQASLALALVGTPKKDEARAAARATSDLAGRLAAWTPSYPEALRLQAQAAMCIALVSPNAERLPHWQRAAAASQAWLDLAPGVASRQRTAALMQKYLGGQYENDGKYAVALEHHLKALALDEQRLKADPGSRSARLDYAIDLSNVGFAHWQTGDLGLAATMYERSLVIRQGISDSDPEDVFARDRLAYVRSRLGAVYSAMGKRDLALSNLRVAASLSASLASRDALYLSQHAENLMRLGELLLDTGRPAEGCSTLEKAQGAFRKVLEQGGGPSLSSREELNRRYSARAAERLAACRPSAGAGATGSSGR